MKIVVLTTSDIQSLEKVTDDGGPWEGTRYYEGFSKGRMEECIKHGYTVFVATTRVSLAQSDDWWVDEVGRNNVFLAKYADDGHLVSTDYATSAGWIACFERLGIPYPTNEYDEMPMFWTRAMYQIREAGAMLWVDFAKHHAIDRNYDRKLPTGSGGWR